MTVRTKMFIWSWTIASELNLSINNLRRFWIRHSQKLCQQISTRTQLIWIIYFSINFWMKTIQIWVAVELQVQKLSSSEWARQARHQSFFVFKTNHSMDASGLLGAWRTRQNGSDVANLFKRNFSCDFCCWFFWRNSINEREVRVSSDFEKFEEYSCSSICQQTGSFRFEVTWRNQRRYWRHSSSWTGSLLWKQRSYWWRNYWRTWLALWTNSRKQVLLLK
jgi:hypothetical protein